MRKLLYGAAMAAAAISALSCSDGSRKESDADGRNLYREQKELIKLYVDSLKHLPDTVDATKMIDNFQDRLFDINMKYPADTDLKMTEGENEVLYKMMRNLVKLAQRHGVEVDSYIDLKTDTVVRIEYNPNDAKRESSPSKPKTERKQSAETPPAAEAAEPTPAPATPAPTSTPASTPEPAAE